MVECKACGELETYSTLFCVSGSFIVEQDESRATKETRPGRHVLPRKSARINPIYCSASHSKGIVYYLAQIASK